VPSAPFKTPSKSFCKRASKETLGGRLYLELRREAKRTWRPTDALIHLYALECFLDRLVPSEFFDTFILKGGVLLAAPDAVHHGDLVRVDSAARPGTIPAYSIPGTHGAGVLSIDRRACHYCVCEPDRTNC
jgi:hypothetical protein